MKRKARTLTTDEIRSRTMRAVKGKDTAPELTVRKALWNAGLRYRLHDKKLPGKPDIVFPSRRLVVFVHGCFWHGHAGCPRHRIPQTHVEYWTAKISRNMERDAQTRKKLKRLGWQVLTIWECEAKSQKKIEKLISNVLSVEAL